MKLNELNHAASCNWWCKEWPERHKMGDKNAGQCPYHLSRSVPLPCISVLLSHVSISIKVAF